VTHGLILHQSITVVSVTQFLRVPPSRHRSQGKLAAKGKIHRMAWDEISALAALAGAIVVLVGSVAAIVQLKHLRLTYQIESYVELMLRLTSPEMVAAVEYVKTCDFHDPAQRKKALAEGVDHRVLMYGGYYQMVARLINLGIADRDLFAAIVTTAPQAWKRVGPLALAWREEQPANPRWADLEYLVLSALRKRSLGKSGYDIDGFRARVLEPAVEIWRRDAEDSLSS
jgi:hypothetical protein